MGDAYACFHMHISNYGLDRRGANVDGIYVEELRAPNFFAHCSTKFYLFILKTLIKSIKWQVMRLRLTMLSASLSSMFIPTIKKIVKFNKT